MTNKGLTENQKRDYDKYYVENPTSGFSPEKNNYIIEKTIREYEAKRLEEWKRYKEGVAERVDAAMDYVNYLERGGASPAEQYFGKREFARLRGQKIMQQVKLDRNGSPIITLSEGF